MLNRMIFVAAAAAVLMPVLATSALAAPIVFDFVDTTIPNAAVNKTAAFDSTGVGANVTYSDGTTPVMLTTTDVQAPEFSGTTLTGNQTSAAGRAGFVTALNTTFDLATTSTEQMGINNITISDANGSIAGIGANESGQFNLNEAWLFKFDKDITFTQMNLASVDSIAAAGTADDRITVTIGALGSFNLVDGQLNDDYNDPFNGLVIPAGTEITFKNTTVGTGAAAAIVRIDSFTVTPFVAPEPATLAAAAMGTLALVRRRRA